MTSSMISLLCHYFSSPYHRLQINMFIIVDASITLQNVCVGLYSAYFYFFCYNYHCYCEHGSISNCQCNERSKCKRFDTNYSESLFKILDISWSSSHKVCDNSCSCTNLQNVHDCQHTEFNVVHFTHEMLENDNKISSIHGPNNIGLNNSCLISQQTPLSSKLPWASSSSIIKPPSSSTISTKSSQYIEHFHHKNETTQTSPLANADNLVLLRDVSEPSETRAPLNVPGGTYNDQVSNKQNIYLECHFIRIVAFLVSICESFYLQFFAFFRLTSKYLSVSHIFYLLSVKIALFPKKKHRQLNSHHRHTYLASHCQWWKPGNLLYGKKFLDNFNPEEICNTHSCDIIINRRKTSPCNTPSQLPLSPRVIYSSANQSFWSVTRFSCTLFFILIVILHGLPIVASQGISGTATTCTNENKPVKIPGITDDPCISCFCQQGVVQCKKKRCQKLEGCHAILFDQPREMCCDVCKGCRYKGTQYQSGDQWRDEKKPCLVLSCRAGVVTKSKMKCFTHCYDAKPVEGQCCPVCSSCQVRGRPYKEGDRFTLTTDRCTECLCKNNSVLCERKQCPVLNCPSEVIYQPKDQCCPKCRGMRRVFEVRSRCYFAKRIYKRHQRFRPDKCSSCVCKSGTSVCKSESCPPLDCPKDEQIFVPGSKCCKKCVDKKFCLFEGKKYKHREEWRPNVCMGCSCDEGVTHCQRERCSNSLWCPQGYRLLLSPDECCPKCVEHDAVCSVFGDPHYRTFDGLMYSFQGTCKYILAKDCSPRPEFYIKVRNGVRFSSGYAWTQMLVVYVYGKRVSMLQGAIVKVNSRRVKPPYARDKISIVMDGDLVKLKTTLGLQVTWDGDSFLEVKVNTRFKNRMCGLCGNYNGIKSDDLIGRDGTIYDKGGEYGHSWRIGSERACAKTPKFVEKEPLCEHDDRAKRRAHRVCNAFFGRVFSKCRAKLKVDNYVSSCITDMCDCPEGHDCACEAIKAYISLCERSGISIDRNKIRICRAPETKCPPDSTLVKCKETCPRSCHRNAVPRVGIKPEPCPERCLDGCMCNDGQKVLHAGKCILRSLCPPNS